MKYGRIYFEDVQVGDALPPLVKGPIQQIQLTRYAGASLDFNPIHQDDEFARAAGMGGVFAGPILSVYPGLDSDMLPLALVVVILGGAGSLAGAFIGSVVIGFIYTFGQALLPDLAYVILFLPMVIVLVVRPRGLFGRVAA